MEAGSLAVIDRLRRLSARLWPVLRLRWLLLAVLVFGGYFFADWAIGALNDANRAKPFLPGGLRRWQSQMRLDDVR